MVRFAVLALAAMGTIAATVVIAPTDTVLAIFAYAILWLLYALVARSTHRAEQRALDAVAPPPPPPPKVETIAEDTSEWQDPETGLPGVREFRSTISRELARSRRYGEVNALVLLEVAPATTPGMDLDSLPSPGPFVATILRKASRETDAIARLDQTHFGVLLVGCNSQGCQEFVHRVRTALSKSPYGQTSDGHWVFARTRAGWATTDDGIESVAQYVRAALKDMARRQPGLAA
ncbi:MAG: hypothetical protein Kow0010_02790 [Dehalococcoidia bacterium]